MAKNKPLKNAPKKKTGSQKASHHNVHDLHDPVEIARRLHSAMLPETLPRTEKLFIDSLFFPCPGVGGNCYDIIKLSDDRTAVLLFDIENTSGTTAGLLTSFVKLLFTTHIHAHNSPQHILESVSVALSKALPQNCHLSAFIAFLDLNSNRLVYCVLGQIYPFMYKASQKKCELLRVKQPLPKFTHGIHCEQNVQNLLPGDWIILLTHGFVRRFFNDDRKQLAVLVQQSLLQERRMTVSDWLTIYREEHGIGLKNQEQTADITAIVLEILTQENKRSIMKSLGFSRDRPVFLQFLSSYEEIDSITSRILKEMDETGYSDEIIRKMKLTVTELLANAIGHGNKNDGRKKVTIGHVIEPEETCIGIIDEGEGFDPTDIPDPTLPENLIKDHGRGLYIVGNFVDEIRFNKKGNRVLIKKYRTKRS